MTGYGPENEGSFTGKRRNFFLNHNVLTGPGTQPASCQMCNIVSFPGELLDHEADHLPPTSDVFQNVQNVCTYLHSVVLNTYIYCTDPSRDVTAMEDHVSIISSLANLVIFL